MDDPRDSPPPPKRRRLSQTPSATYLAPSITTQPLPPTTMASAADEELQKELRSGITAFVNPDVPGFSGILKQRYTDFLVNEILPNGHVLHLLDLKPRKQGKQEQKSEQREEPKPPSTSAPETKPIAQESTNGMENAKAGQDAGAQIPEDDRTILNDLLGERIAVAVVELYREMLRNPARKAKEHRRLQSEVIKDRDFRTKIHKEMRRIFSSRFETTTSDDDTIAIIVAPPNVKGRGGDSTYHAPFRGKLGWQELGGDYLHFTMYKENKDTMEVMSFLSSRLKVQPRSFQFSGTKDRRAVSVQRCSAYRIRADQLAPLNRWLRGAKVGDFQHNTTGLELGDLGGNEFVITLRECHFPGEEGLDVQDRLALAEKVVSEAVETFRISGYINFYGLQRFGSFSTSTDTIGTKMLQSDYAGAVADILSFSEASLAAAQDPEDTSLISYDDKARAEALNIWLTDKDQARALDKLPHKFSAERSIISHLGRRNRGSNTFPNMNDYQGALGTIPRNLRLMYVHAYQSLVWNTVAGKRLELYGHKVVEGDLVLVSEDKAKHAASGVAAPTVDEQGEVIVQVAPTDSATKADDFERARPLSAEEAASGTYTVFDLVLPLPGWDVVYPSNAVSEEYETFMASGRGGGLDPHDMRRSNKDLSLSGGYRKLLARADPGMNFEIKTYRSPHEQLVQTDLEILEAKKEMNGSGQSNGVKTEPVKEAPKSEGKVEGKGGQRKEGEKLAVVLKMKLGSSQYATMALRELMKKGGVQTYKPDFGSGR